MTRLVCLALVVLVGWLVLAVRDAEQALTRIVATCPKYTRMTVARYPYRAGSVVRDTVWLPVPEGCE